MKRIFKALTVIIIVLVVVAFCVAIFTVFFDQAVLVRKGTIYRVPTDKKVVALTFDDGPSPEWTPKILDELKLAGVKATFFLLGEHVKKYPDIARRIAEEGHEIGNHTFDHRVLLYYKDNELVDEIKEAEQVIREVTGRTTRYFRPPKAWLTNREKKIIADMGYKTVLWTLNSKDWVTFHDKQIVSYIMRHVQPGDIILFHDSGGTFSVEGGRRKQTVKTIPRLAKKLREQGYYFVTISELLNYGK
jgi:peptidoglycan/xylan/chitin deacetylase (PgdA/CDA1 family)